MQWIAYKTLVRKEVHRFMRIWQQTLLPPVITQSLYFMIFGKFIGSQLNDINGVTYMAFIVPGLVMMSVINASYSNVVSSFFSSKFQRSVEELMVSPVRNEVIIAGYITGGALRGVMTGMIVFIVSAFFTRPTVHQAWVLIVFIVLTAVVFALGGMLNAIFAKKFDDIAIFPTFILTPLIYLGGVFYSLKNLPEIWQHVSKFNPVLYMVNGFRYGFYGFSDVPLMASLGILIFFAALLAWLNLYLLRKGIGLRT